MPEQRADEVRFFNRSTKLKSSNVQSAIEELSRSSVNPAIDKIADPGSGSVITKSERIKLTGIESMAKDDQSAAEVPYANDGSDIMASTVQGAIDEIANKTKSIAFHAHSHLNAKALDAIAGSGSGVVISKQERSSLHQHDNKNALEAIKTSGSGDVITVSERMKLNGIELHATVDQSSSEVPYNDTLTSLGADSVQAAIEATNRKIDNKKDGHEHLNRSVLESLENAGSKRVITSDERDKLNSVEDGATRDQNAREVSFDPSGTGYTATDVQSAFSETSESLNAIGRTSHEHHNRDALDVVSDASFILPEEREKLSHSEYGATADQDAEDVPFDNQHTGLSADNLQAAVEEVAATVGHQHKNKDVIDGIEDIGSGKIITELERSKFVDLNTAIKGFHQLHKDISDKSINRIDLLESSSHEHDNTRALESISEPGSGSIITDTERNKLHTIEPSATQDQHASEVPLSNSGISLSSENVQSAIEEVDGEIEKLRRSQHDHNNGDSLSSIINPGSGSIITSEERNKLASVEYRASGLQDASSVAYEGSESVLSSVTVQGAIDELSARVTGVDIVNHTHINMDAVSKIAHQGSGRVITEAERDKLASIPENASGDQKASTLPFSNEMLQLRSTDVQGAIEEIALSNKHIEHYLHGHDNLDVLHDIKSLGSGCIVTAEERFKLDNVEPGATTDQSAVEVPYVNSASGIFADNVQAAIDEMSLNATHSHTNLRIINNISDFGSGRIITDMEREKIYESTGLQDSYSTPHGDSTVGETCDIFRSSLHVLNDLSHKHDNEVVLSSIQHAGSGRIISDAERSQLLGIEDNATADQDSYEVPHSSRSVGCVLDSLETSVISLASNSHSHPNQSPLDRIVDPGSGSVITAAERLKLSGIDPMASSDQAADSVPYSHLNSSLESEHVQGAIDEIDTKTSALVNKSHEHPNLDLVNQVTDVGSGMVISEAERYKLSNIESNAKDDQYAKDVPYSHDGSDLSSDNLQAAVDEIMIRIRRIENKMHFHENYDIISKISDAHMFDKEAREKLDSIEYGACAHADASQVPFDDTSVSLGAINVQKALEKVIERIS